MKPQFLLGLLAALTVSNSAAAIEKENNICTIHPQSFTKAAKKTSSKPKQTEPATPYRGGPGPDGRRINRN